MTSTRSITPIHPDRNRPRFGSLTRAFAILAGTAVACLMFVASAAAVPLRTLVAFDRAAGQTPENLAIARDGAPSAP